MMVLCVEWFPYELIRCNLKKVLLAVHRKRERHFTRLMAPMMLIYHLFHCCVRDLLSILLMHHGMTLSRHVTATATTRLKRMLWCPRGNQLNYYCQSTKAKPRPCSDSLL